MKLPHDKLVHEVFYADTPDKVARVVAAAGRAVDRGEPVGLDTEFFGTRIGQESTYATAKLHLLSLAVRRFPGTLHPRGYQVADAAVIPVALLGAGGLGGFLGGPGIKAVHNLPVDAHALANAGVTLNGGVNTLDLSRFAWPGRARGPGFTLDALGQDIVGTGKPDSYSAIFVEDVTEYRTRTRKSRCCECGATPCRVRQSTPGHRRIERVEETRIPKMVQRPVPLESVVPGHPVWPRALAYAAVDAVLALYIYELAMAELNRQVREIPWL